MATRGIASLRYRLVKLSCAAEDAVATFSLPATQAKGAALPDVLRSAWSAFQQSLESPLTCRMVITGAAMSPTLNRKSAADKDAIEQLVVRLIPRPSNRNVLVGDVVAFSSPLAAADEQHVMVRRVAALEGEEMVATTSTEEEEPFTIPPDHAWVLADNPELKPPAVIDSRSFGHIALNTIIGRVIYAGSSRAEHGPVLNNPESVGADEAVVEEEVDLDALFKEPASSDDES